MQKKIRTAQQQKIPFMVIAGDEDVGGGTVSFRYRDGSQRNGVAARRGRGARASRSSGSRTNSDRPPAERHRRVRGR